MSNFPAPNQPEEGEIGVLRPKRPPSYLTETNGKPSAMRMMSFLCLLVAVLCAAVILLSDGPESIRSPDVYVFSAFLLAAFAPKAIQKFAEDTIQQVHKE